MTDIDTAARETPDHRRDGTDAALVQRAMCGEPTSFRQVHHRYAGAVRGELRRRGVRHADLDDLAQEVFTRAWLGLPTLRDHERFEPWVRQIARNVVIDHYRRSSCRPGLLAVPLEAESSPSDPTWCPHSSVEIRQLVDLVREGIAGLTGRDEVVLTMAFDGRATPDEIAAELGITAGNARVLLHRARRRLRTTVGPLLDAS